MNYTPFLILLVFLVLCIYLIFRKKKLQIETLSKNELDILSKHVDFYKSLDREQKLLFGEKVVEFLATVKIEGVGVSIMPIDRMLVAASAIIPIFGFGDWKYKNLTNVILYPDTFNENFQFTGDHRNIMGMVGSGFMNGQMVLSQSALHNGFSNKTGKENTGIHEFVHLLDKSDGATDGVPENLMKHSYTLPWINMMHQEMKEIKSDKSDINPYALTNQAEFFAVVSEYFFEQPQLLKNRHPELYERLTTIFQQNPV
ncbi:MAG: zinc-dependent peptidase [Pedobacter sp.]|nr:MAG: zinc-dependent peptidase [Pedobacter sp.]